MKKIIIGLIFLLMISFAFAEESGGVLTAKQYDCIKLPQECVLCTDVKITTITYPNMSQLSIQTSMTQDSTSWSYSFCNTETLGTYSYCTVGDTTGSGTYDAVACKDFEVTPSGFTGTLGFYFLILILSAGIILLGIYVQDAWIVILGSFGLDFIGLFILFNGIDGMKDPVYTWAIGIIILMLASYISIKSGFEVMGDD